MKYKATINIDREKWDKYLARCKELGSNGSIEFEKFIDCFVNGREYKYESEEDWETLPEAVKVFEEILVERVLSRLKNDQLTTTPEIVPGQWKRRLTGKPIGTDIETDTSTEPILQETPSAPLLQKTNNPPGQTDTQTDASIGSLKSASNSKQEDSMKTTTEGLSSIYEPVPYREDYARVAYTDKQVADIEGLNKSTVTRRRNGKTKNREGDFWKKWEVSKLNPTKWWLVQAPKPD